MKKDDARRESGGVSQHREGDGAALATVSALMAERRRYEAWIDALDTKRAATPEHVFSRVHADYVARLDAVVLQLTTHGDALRREIDSLSLRLGSLRDERQRAADERSEAELRAHVGELSPEDWSKVSGASDERLNEITGRQSALEDELARTLELLNETQRPPTPAAGTPAVAPEPARSVPATPRFTPGAQPRVSAPVAVPTHAPPPPVERPSSPAAQVASSAPPDQHSLGIEEAKAHAPPRRNTGFDELAFLSSVVDTPAGPTETPPRDEPDEDTKVKTFRNSQEDAVVGHVGDLTPPRPLAAIEVERDQEPLIAPSADGNKTLKCGECGALNYPTEWYCERCGAELASL